MAVSYVSENHAELENTESGAKAKPPFEAMQLAGLACALALTVAVYHGVLQNIFHSDDYAHIRWAYHAMSHPELVLQDFVSSWAGCNSVPFYRPLSSLFIFIDYCIWGNNGFGFHLTNLALHMATSVVVWAVTLEFAAQMKETHADLLPITDNSGKVWALAAASLFAIYPLLPEAVCWMIGRVDLLATCFSLSAFWLYMRWRRTKRGLSLAGSLACFALSLCSKESGVTLPAVLLAFSFIAERTGGEEATQRNIVRLLIIRAFDAIKASIPFWVVLGLYMAVRVYALKTVIGGYGNVLPALSELSILVKVWAGSFSVLFSPFNVNLFSPTDTVVRLWQVCMLLCAVASLAQLFRSATSVRLTLFFVAWMSITLLPVLKYFDITPDLQGGRMAYMCCVPFLLMITHGASYLFDRSKLAYAAHVLLSTLVCVGAFITSVNCQPWQRAGEEMRAVHDALNNQYKTFPIGKFLYFVGVPDQVQGAYAGVNAMEALFQRPQLPQDVQLCCNLSPADLFEPYGFIRNSLLTTNACKLYTWDSPNKKFSAFGAPLSGPAKFKNWNNRELASLLMPSPSNGNGRIEYDFSQRELNCWDAEFLQLKLQVVRPQLWRADNRLGMRFANSLQPNANSSAATPIVLQPGAIQSVLVPMHSNVIWSLGGKCQKLCLEYPAKWKVQLIGLTTRNSEGLLPSLNIEPKNPTTSLGTVWSSQVGAKFFLNYDARQIENSSSVALEISRPNAFFVHQNANGPAVEAGAMQPHSALQGRIEVDGKALVPGAFYEMRIRALDSFGHTMGFASDHIVYMN